MDNNKFKLAIRDSYGKILIDNINDSLYLYNLDSIKLPPQLKDNTIYPSEEFIGINSVEIEPAKLKSLEIYRDEIPEEGYIPDKGYDGFDRVYIKDKNIDERKKLMVITEWDENGYPIRTRTENVTKIPHNFTGFDESIKEEYYVPALSRLKESDINEGVTEIGGFYSRGKVILPDTLENGTAKVYGHGKNVGNAYLIETHSGEYPIVAGGSGRTIKIPEGPKWINETAFYDSRSDEIILSSTIEGLGPYCFARNKLPENLENVKYIDSNGLASSFSDSRIVNLKSAVKLGSYLFDGYLNSINKKGPEKILLPNLKKADSWAFYNLYNLKEIELDNLEELGAIVYKCHNLKKIYAPKLKKIGAYGLNELDSLDLSCINFDNIIEITNYYSIKLKQLVNLTMNNLELITGTYSITGNENLISIDLPKLKSIKSSGNTFSNNNNLEYINLPELENLEYTNGNNISYASYLFYNCPKLKTVNIPKLKIISNQSFYNTGIEEFNNSLVEKVLSSAFSNCSKLKTVNIENNKFIGGYAFNNCKELISINSPSCNELESYVFSNCPKLETINLGKLTKIGYNCFENCKAKFSIESEVKTIPQYCYRNSNVESIKDNICEKIGYNAINNNPNLKVLELPNLISCESYNNLNNTLIERLEFNKLTNMNTLSMSNMPNLKYLKVPNYTNSGSFSNCPNLKVFDMRGRDINLSIPYISSSNYSGAHPDFTILLDNDVYKKFMTSNYWSSIIEDITYLDIDSPNYVIAFNKTKDIEIQYHSIPNISIKNITSENEITINNYEIVNNKIKLNITEKGNIIKDSFINITVGSSNEYVDNMTFSVKIPIVERLIELPYSVNHLSGSVFNLNTNGFYESSNKSNNSYSLCKVNITGDGTIKLFLDCINSGESNYDFGIISKLDNTLSSSYNIDDSNIYMKSFQGLSSNDIQTVDFGIIPSGNHFITIKYRKDSSNSSGKDSLQFKLRFGE